MGWVKKEKMNFETIKPNGEMGQKIRSQSQYIQVRFLSEPLLAAIKEIGVEENKNGYIICFGFYGLSNVVVSGNNALYSFSL
jgi:hypothetical protein